jgi:hypothetical protein
MNMEETCFLRADARYGITNHKRNEDIKRNWEGDA